MLKNLIATMAKRGISSKMIADLLGMTERQVLNRLYGEGEFTLSQGLKIYDTFFSDCDLHVLFMRKA